MTAKIFVNYRRDDVPGDARGVRDGLAAKFGKANVFMDVDNLLAGQRFDIELAKALDACDVLIAVIGPRWMELFTARTAGGERDYVREEIAAALTRRIVVIPVRVGREGSMPTLPRRDDLPEDIRDLVLHQKLDVAHERFGRDIVELIEGIVAVRKSIAAGAQPGRVRAVPLGWIGASIVATLLAGYVGAHSLGVPVPRPWSPSVDTTEQNAAAKRALATKAEAERQKAAAETTRKAEEAAEAERVRVAAEQRDKQAAEQRERQAAEQRANEAAAEAKRKAADAEARRAPKAGETFRDCQDGCPKMVVVPPGTFKMGEGSSARDVTIPAGFAVGKFTVTFAEWEACVGGRGCQANTSPSDNGWGKGSRPVINVSWNDAKEYEIGRAHV